MKFGIGESRKKDNLKNPQRRNFLIRSMLASGVGATAAIGGSQWVMANDGDTDQRRISVGWVSDLGQNDWSEFSDEFKSMATAIVNPADLQTYGSNAYAIVELDLGLQPHPFSSDPKVVYSALHYLKNDICWPTDRIAVMIRSYSNNGESDDLHRRLRSFGFSDMFKKMNFGMHFQQQLDEYAVLSTGQLSPHLTQLPSPIIYVPSMTSLPLRQRAAPLKGQDHLVAFSATKAVHPSPSIGSSEVISLVPGPIFGAKSVSEAKMSLLLASDYVMLQGYSSAVARISALERRKLQARLGVSYETNTPRMLAPGQLVSSKSNSSCRHSSSLLSNLADCRAITST